MSHRCLSLAPLFLIFLSGCATMEVLQTKNTIMVSSNPSGAGIFILGDSVGTTPLEIKQADVYPISYDLDREKLYGIVEIKKPGCQDSSTTVTRRMVNTGIHVNLDCGTQSVGEVSTAEPKPGRAPTRRPSAAQPPEPNSRAPAPKPIRSTVPQPVPPARTQPVSAKPAVVQHTAIQPAPKPAKTARVAAPIPSSIRERLLRLNQLRDQKLITEEEYSQARIRILNEL